MLSNSSFFHLFDLAQARAEIPQAPITAFCRCALTPSGTGCMRRPRARRRRSRRSRVIQGRSNDPGDGAGNTYTTVRRPS